MAAPFDPMSMDRPHRRSRRGPAVLVIGSLLFAFFVGWATSGPAGLSLPGRLAAAPQQLVDWAFSHGAPAPTPAGAHGLPRPPAAGHPPAPAVGGLPPGAAFAPTAPAVEGPRASILMVVASWLSLGLAVSTAGMMALIVMLRTRLTLGERRAKRFYARWRPIMMKSVLDGSLPRKLPRLRRDEWILLFGLWNHLHESVRGDARHELNEFARAVGLPEMARRFMTGSGVRRQLIGLLAIGNLRDGSSWFVLKEMLALENPVLSLAALRALLRIDPLRAMPLILPHVGRRSDWSPVRVASFLDEAGSDAIARPIAKAALAAPPAEASRLVRYLVATNCTTALPSVRGLLEGTQDVGLIAACLPMLREPRDLPILRRYLRHEVWFVRVQAASTLGKIGEPGDERLLSEMLADRDWWVRYRAAQALAALPFVGTGDLRAIRVAKEDVYARDILSQVLAEVPLA